MDFFKTDSDQLDAVGFRALLLGRFPELEEEVEDYEGLTHLEMGSVEGLANAAIAAGDMKRLQYIYEFVAYIARHSQQVDAGITNAVNVSFLEGLRFDHKIHARRHGGCCQPCWSGCGRRR